MYSKMQGRGGFGGNGLWLCAPCSSNTMISPGSMSRTYLRADDVERAGLRRQDRAAVEFAQHQRADAERIARADQLLVGQRHQRIGALDGAQRLDEAVDEAAALGLRDQMQDHLGVGGRLHHGAVAHEFAAQRQAVGEIAVMADREAAGIELGEQRLHVAQDGRAGGGVADMADRGIAGQALDHLAAGEGVADEAEPAFAVEARAVEGDDAGGFLAAMLQGVQAERGDGGGFGMAENAEHAAFLAQRVAFEVVLQIDGRESGSSWSAGSEGLCISSIAPLFCGPRSTSPRAFSISFFRLSRAGLL